VSNTIKIYNVSSGEVVKTLSTSVAQGGHRLTVTALSLNPKNPLQLFSASLDGTIKLWDYNDNILLKVRLKVTVNAQALEYNSNHTLSLDSSTQPSN
jgi:WD40 repeat protein